MIEFLLFLGFASVLGGGVVAIVKRGITSRRFHINPELDAPPAPRMLKGPAAPLAIEASVRAELDSTPEWWDGQFHKALSASGAPVLAEIEGELVEVHTYSGTVRYTEIPGHSVLEGCTCDACRLDNN